jgi:hypothetical protein
MRKNNQQTTIHKGYVSHTNWLFEQTLFSFKNY